MDDKKNNAKGVSPHLIIVVSAVLGVAVSVVFFGLVRFAAKRVLSEVAGRIGGSDAEAVREFDEWMTAWTENARTNMAVETSARFRDEVVIPFLKREMPNPFSEGGAESGQPWAKEAERVYEAGLRDVCDTTGWVQFDHRNCRAAGKLYDEGCREPFITLLSALSSANSSNDPDNAMKRVAEVEKTFAEGPESDFMRLLAAVVKWKLRRGDASAMHRLFVAWVKGRGFTRDDEVVLYQLHWALLYNDDGTLKGIPALAWASKLESAKRVFFDAGYSAGWGVASSISRKGWRTLHEQRNVAARMLDDAESLRPGRLETRYFRLWTDGGFRGGDRNVRARLFEEISELRLDHAASIEKFVWYNLYPRWSGDRGRRMMLRFADACYETGRHDTALPYFYADTMCRYVRDTATDPFEYFRGHPDVADKCIDVCMRQTTNELACGYVRIRAPFVGAAVAYYAGRYEKAAEFSPYFDIPDSDLDELFFEKKTILESVNAFVGNYSNLCLRLQRLYDDGRNEELLDEVAKLPAETYENYWFKQYVHTLALNARMKADFVEGKDVKGEVLTYVPGWEGYAWWRTNDRTWQTRMGFKWEDHLTWRARIPQDHELEFVLSPKPKTNGRHVLVVSRCVYEETHLLPINKIPFVTLIWEKDRTGVYIENNYYKMFAVDPARAEWKDAQGEKRKVRIVCDGGRVEVYVDGGDAPAVSTSAHAAAIRRSPETGRARFHGEDVRISDIAVRRPKTSGELP